MEVCYDGALVISDSCRNVKYNQFAECLLVVQITKKINIEGKK